MKLKLLFIDTETSGLINNNETDINKQPEILQFCGFLGTYHTDYIRLEIDSIYNRHFEPNGPISHSASLVNGLTKEKLKGKGHIQLHLDDIIDLFKKADYVIGHNIMFDLSCVDLECKRYGLDYDVFDVDSICTMETTKNVFKLPNKSGTGYKRPKLSEMYYLLFESEIPNAHDAYYDVEATMKCFMELCKSGIYNFD